MINFIKRIYHNHKAKSHWKRINQSCTYGTGFWQSPSPQFQWKKNVNLKIYNHTKDKNKIRFGKNCNVAATIVLNSKGSIVIGDYVYMNNIHLRIDYNLKIGSYCMFGPNVKLWDTKNHPLNREERREQCKHIAHKGIIDSYEAGGGDIIIGDDVWVGMDSIIMGRVTIGNGSVVAAGSIVTKSVPENVLVGGIPARIIKQL